MPMPFRKRQAAIAGFDEATRAEMRRRSRRQTRARARRYWQLYAMLVIPVVALVLFAYLPMVGVQIAFRNYNPIDGVWHSPWVGFDMFRQFFESYQFGNLLKNTIVLHLIGLVAGFPLPILLALMLTHVGHRLFANSVQVITYAPYFISVVAMVGMVFLAVDPNFGFIGQAIKALGIAPPDFLSDPKWFRPLYVLSGIWQGTGFSAVIYLAALSGIDPSLHEAAKVDGANLLRRMWHIDLPGIMPVISITLMLSLSSMLTTGYEKVLLFQRPGNLSVSEVIDTYVYKIGFQSDIPQYSFAAAVGVFQSVVGVVLLLTSNWMVRRYSQGNEFF